MGNGVGNALTGMDAEVVDAAFKVRNVRVNLAKLSPSHCGLVCEYYNKTNDNNVACPYIDAK